MHNIENTVSSSRTLFKSIGPEYEHPSAQNWLSCSPCLKNGGCQVNFSRPGFGWAKCNSCSRDRCFVVTALGVLYLGAAPSDT